MDGQFIKHYVVDYGEEQGFRDQLHDVISIKYFDPEITKKQIIKHANHQFIEGDVEHWWHEDTNRGIRTKFSDDLLWLPFVHQTI